MVNKLNERKKMVNLIITVLIISALKDLIEYLYYQ